MTQSKENAIPMFLEMIKESWTYARLTEEERQRFLDTVEWAYGQGYIKGDFQTRYGIMQCIYDAFLAALDYKPTGWRE